MDRNWIRIFGGCLSVVVGVCIMAWAIAVICRHHSSSEHFGCSDPCATKTSCRKRVGDHPRRALGPRCLSPDTTVDYVIVGSGCAGSAMAFYLAKRKPHARILLLEAGIDYSCLPLMTDSNRITELVFYKEDQFDYRIVTVFQENLQRSLDFAGVRALGGGSKANGTFWVRGSDHMYAKWATFGWSLDRIHAASNLIERYAPRGTTGRINIRETGIPSQAGIKFSQAVTAVTGYPLLADYNDPATPLGPTYLFQWSQKGDKRVDAVTAFLRHAPPNVQIHTSSTALRVKFDEKHSHTATGVDVLRRGRHETITANKEVIISAGIHSSALLLQSGVTVDGEVGYGVNDALVVLFEMSANPNDPPLPEPNSPAAFIAFLPNPSDVGQPQAYRTIQLLGRTGLVPGILTVAVLLTNTKSKGRIRLAKGNDPLAKPRVDLAVLEDPRDMQQMMDAFRSYVLPITTAMSAIDPLYQLLIPSAATIGDDALLKQYILDNAMQPTTAHNYTGHCRIGRVVDGDGRVYGYEGLRVVDASISNPSDGGTQELAYMVGAGIATSM